MKIVAGGGKKKAQNFGPPPPFGAPPFGASTLRGPPPSGFHPSGPPPFRASTLRGFHPSGLHFFFRATFGALPFEGTTLCGPKIQHPKIGRSRIGRSRNWLKSKLSEVELAEVDRSRSVATWTCALEEDLPTRLQVRTHPTTSPRPPTSCGWHLEQTVVTQLVPSRFHTSFPRSSMSGGRSAALFQTRVLPVCKRIPATAHNCSANKL